MTRFLRFALGCLLAPVVAGAEPALRVVASVFPIEDMVAAIGGDRVHVETFLDSGDDCHSFNPSPRKLQRLSAAQLFVSVGVGYESGLLPKIHGTFPNVQVLPLNDSARLLLESVGDDATSAAHDNHGHDHAGHVHGPHCAHGAVDPHSWLAPEQARAHARAIAARLSKLDPSGAAHYATRLAALEARIDALDARLRALLGAHAGAAFIVYHPAFGHFADAYGLHQIAVEEDGKAPSARRLNAMVADARASGVRAVIIQPQEPEAAVARIAAALGVTPLPADPMAHDWQAALLGLGESLATAFAATSTHEGN